MCVRVVRYIAITMGPMSTNKKFFISLLFAFFCVGIFFFGVRGFSGVPDIATLNSTAWITDGPLELSPERGRFALLYSFIEDKSLIFSVPVARLATPDLGMNKNGQYVSLFAPGVSFIVIPGYLLGKLLGASQVGAYLVISLFALLNIFLIRSIALRLGAGYFAALLAGLTFAFATPAFAYGVNLYQHHISTFVMLLSLYLLIRFRHPLVFALVWFLCSASVVIDNPNLFLMLPIGLYALTKFWKAFQEQSDTSGFSWLRGIAYATTFFTLLVPMAFFLWYNQGAYGNPFQLPGTLQGVDEIGPDGKPAKINTYEKEIGLIKEDDLQKTSKEKTAVGFFKTRDLYGGFYTHFLSPDRSVLYFAPVILLGIIGLGLLYRRNTNITGLLIAIIGMNVLTYSLWGDPYGGWAFGSRYLIPTYALLAIGISFGFSQWQWKMLFIILFVPLLAYSVWVNTLGALTTSANPPQVEVLALEKQTGHEQKYTFMRNWEFLHQKYEKIGSKSFVYQVWAKNYFSASQYFFSVYTFILFIFWLVFVGMLFENRKNMKN